MHQRLYRCYHHIPLRTPFDEEPNNVGQSRQRSPMSKMHVTHQSIGASVRRNAEASVQCNVREKDVNASIED